MIKLELFAEDRGLWRSRVVVSVVTMWHHYRWLKEIRRSTWEIKNLL